MIEIPADEPERLPRFIDPTISSFLYNGNYIVVVKQSGAVYVANMMDVVYEGFDTTKSLHWHRID